MLQVGLTGGIGSGKSTVARRLVEHGAVLIDADVIAREVVAPGTDGLAELVDAFGRDVLASDGSLDRPALAAVAFADDAARATLNGITHPRVRRRAAELQADAPADAVVVQDIPLLVENGMAAAFALVVVVDAAPEARVRRLVEQRGMPEADARARIAAQADEAARRVVADVWVDNGGGPAATAAFVDRLWADRLAPFEENLRLGRAAAAGRPEVVDADPGWPAAAARLAARVRLAAGEMARDVAHIGATAIAGMPAEDVIELQLGVASMTGDLRAALAAAGFVPRSGEPAGPGQLHGSGQLYGSADPGRPARLSVRVTGSPGWRNALLRRDWLCADAGAVAEYLAVARTAGAHDDAEVTALWFHEVAPRAERWAATSGWSPSLH